MSSKTFIITLLAVPLLLASGNSVAWAGDTIQLDNRERNNVSVRFTTINPLNPLATPGSEDVRVDKNTSIFHKLKDTCITAVYVNDSIRWSSSQLKATKSSTRACIETSLYNYRLIIESDRPVTFQRQ